MAELVLSQVILPLLLVLLVVPVYPLIVPDFPLAVLALLSVGLLMADCNICK